MTRPAALVLLLIITLVSSALRVLAQNIPTDKPTAEAPAGPVYPLKASVNNRYLVDQNNTPFMMVGDSPQNLITNASEKEAAAYMANRRSYGINALWINLLCIFTDFDCNQEAKTFDGIMPFLVSDDIATPNPAYFQRVDDMLHIGMDYGMVILLDPIETSNWLAVLRKNGESKAFEYGRYLGNRYKGFPNIIWMHGNDFQSWQDSTDTALVQAVARGIRNEDKIHMHTAELNYPTSGSLDDPGLAPHIDLDAAYTYFPTYAQVLIEYNRPEHKPVFMVEANYEFEKNFDPPGGSANYLRRGATGQLYGSRYTERMNKGWESNLDTPGVLQLKYMKDLFVNRRWYDLVPDQKHTVMTDGYGVFPCFAGKLSPGIRSYVYLGGHPLLNRILRHAFMAADSCAVAARNLDGSLVLAYMPTIRTITIDMSKLSGSATARWYDPSSGDFVNVSGSPVSNSGIREFRPIGQNHVGDGDWVLVLEAQ